MELPNYILSDSEGWQSVYSSTDLINWETLLAC